MNIYCRLNTYAELLKQVEVNDVYVDDGFYQIGLAYSVVIHFE